MGVRGSNPLVYFMRIIFVYVRLSCFAPVGPPAKAACEALLTQLVNEGVFPLALDNPQSEDHAIVCRWLQTAPDEIRCLIGDPYDC